MYSQVKEDEIVFELFRLTNYKGTVLEIGANDGRTLSNSRYFIENGWSACLIEPAPKPLAKLRELYKDSTTVHVFGFGLGESEGTFDFFDSGSHLTAEDSSLLSTLDEKELKRWGPSEVFNKIQIDVKTFPYFLEQSPLKKFDYISIDIEGLDYIVLTQIDLAAVECKVLCIEWNNNNETYDQINTHMLGLGYKLHHKNTINLIYTI